MTNFIKYKKNIVTTEITVKRNKIEKKKKASFCLQQFQFLCLKKYTWFVTLICF